MIHWPAWGQASSPQAQPPFVFRTWKSEDGLPHNSVTAITQTPDGYLWLGTYNGLARFDGVHCQVLGLKNGLRSLQISALLPDSHGTLWIGTVGGGLSRLEHGRIQTLTAANGLAGDTINQLLEDKDGMIWIITTAGLTWWKNGVLATNVPAELKQSYISGLALDQSGAVWLATAGKKFARYQSGHLESMPVPPDLALAESLLVDGQNRLWMGASDGKIFCRNGENGTWTGFGVANGLPKAMISQLAQSPDGTIWAGTLDEGLYYLRDGGFKALRAADGLASDAINSLFIDRDKSIWAGTRAGGVS